MKLRDKFRETYWLMDAFNEFLAAEWIYNLTDEQWDTLRRKLVMGIGDEPTFDELEMYETVLYTARHWGLEVVP